MSIEETIEKLTEIVNSLKNIKEFWYEENN